MIKFFSFVILALLAQIIGIIMWGEYVWLHTSGGGGGSPLESVQPILWVIIVVEVIFFTFLAVYLKTKEG